MGDVLEPLLGLPGVRAAVDDSRSAVDTLLGNRVLRHHSADVSAESSLRGAWASAGLAGVESSLDDLRAGRGLDDPILQGALRTQSAIGALADTWTRAPRQALARLHALAAADLLPAAALGRPVGDTTRLDTLVEVLSATTAPAVVVAAVVHGELLSLDLFPPVSGIVARAAVRLTLVERGLDPKSLVVVEAGHRELRDEYEPALHTYDTDVARWLRHCADAVTAGAREAMAICQAMARR